MKQKGPHSVQLKILALSLIPNVFKIKKKGERKSSITLLDVPELQPDAGAFGTGHDFQTILTCAMEHRATET